MGKHRASRLSSDPRLGPRSLRLRFGSDRITRRSPPIVTRPITSRPWPATATSRTLWHTEFVGATPGYPHELVVDLGSPRNVEGLLYVPRQDCPNGRVKDFEIRVSDDGKTWSEPLASGRWDNDPTFKYVPFRATRARYVQLRGLSEVEGRPFMSAAELGVDASAPTGPPGALGTGRE